MLTDGEAYEVTKVLQENVQAGTGTAANYGCPAAGKTGTTDEAKDAWFVGYTPKLSAAVWVGYPNARHRDAGRPGRHLRRAGLARVHGARPRRPTATTSRRPPSRRSCPPFFGKYARTGIRPDLEPRLHHAGPTGGTHDAPDQKYDPRFYEQAPLDQPNRRRPSRCSPSSPRRATGTATARATGTAGPARAAAAG